MATRKTFYFLTRQFINPAVIPAMLLGILWMVIASGAASLAAAAETGRVMGSVTADRGAVKGFRVKAKDVVNRIHYTTFTKAGRYQFVELPVGTYDVGILQPGFESPVQTVDVKANQTQRVDIALTAVERPPQGGGGPLGTGAAPRDVQLVDYDTLYPPEPGRRELEVTCFGCHWNFFPRRKHDEKGWREAVSRMLTGPTWNEEREALNPLPPDEVMEPIYKYLAKNFGPDSPNRVLKLDEFVPDEDALSQALYIEYEIELPPVVETPRENRRPDRREYGSHRLHDPFVSPVDGTIWYGASGINAMVQLNPRATTFNERWKEFKFQAPRNVFIHGNTMDSKGRVYWAEISGGRVGELDPSTGQVIRHKLPTEGSLLQVVVDSKDNVWYNLVGGSAIGKIDAKTRKVSQWPTPIPLANPYGLAVDPQDNIWTCGLGKPVVLKFDPVQEKWTQYPTPTQPAGTRRIGVDAKGEVWFAEYAAANLGHIDPKTGKITEYKLPLRYTTPYEAWPDNRGSIWITDGTYNALIRFDVQTKKFTYFPLPQLRWSVPKVEIDKDGTVWFGSRGIQTIVGAAFKLKGNAPKPMRASGAEGRAIDPIAD
ncbi:MAG: hypothetical protein A3H28_02255 [Acidobacteria bacterium RIFCSPLOWO2_02_FULL_61_28]|nr:MAG: hypothetical protein A3H28_02255 [Acidobacteria bacterium RIFCSPLOWO2_02_FULL_61_28]